MASQELYSQQSYYFECVCGSDEHTIRFILDPENHELFLHVFLNEPNIFLRIWKGIKYIFGYKCRYGHWDEWVLENSDTQQLKEMCEKHLKGIKNNV